MTDQELRDLVAELAIESKKTDEQLRKTDEQLRQSSIEFDRRIKKLEQLVGSVANNQGDAAEEYFINSLKEKLSIGSLHFDYLIPNYTIRSKSINDEFDILLVNKKSVAIVEVKYKVHPKDILKLPKKIENLKQLPQYREYDIYAGLAGFYIPEEAIEDAIKRGYFILQRRGDLIETIGTDLIAA